MYSFETNTETNKLDLQLLQYDKNFSKKPITQIDVIPEYTLLFSLTDGLLNVNDFSRHGFPLIHSAQRTKGANVFALDIKVSTSHIHLHPLESPFTIRLGCSNPFQRSKSLTSEVKIVCRVCVAVKRKLQCYYWKQNQLLSLDSEIDLNDVPKTVAWNNNFICVGYKTEYVLYDVSSKQWLWYRVSAIKSTISTHFHFTRCRQHSPGRSICFPQARRKPSNRALR